MKTKSYSKLVVCLALMGLLLTNSGCITMSTLEEAKGHSYKNKDGVMVVDKKSEPQLYAFLPLTAAGDIVTFPFQLGLLLLFISHGGIC